MIGDMHGEGVKEKGSFCNLVTRSDMLLFSGRILSFVATKRSRTRYVEVKA